MASTFNYNNNSFNKSWFRFEGGDTVRIRLSTGGVYESAFLIVHTNDCVYLDLVRLYRNQGFNFYKVEPEMIYIHDIETTRIVLTEKFRWKNYLIGKTINYGKIFNELIDDRKKFLDEYKFELL